MKLTKGVTMKLTKTQLRQLVKEEISLIRGTRFLREQSEPTAQKIQDMATELSKNPTIMAFVKKATKDPKVQQIAAKMADEMAGEMNEVFESDNEGLFDMSMASLAGMLGLTSAGMGMHFNSQIASHLQMMGHAAVTSIPTGDFVLPFLAAAGGLGLMAVGLLVASMMEPPRRRR